MAGVVHVCAAFVVQGCWWLHVQTQRSIKSTPMVTLNSKNGSSQVFKLFCSPIEFVVLLFHDLSGGRSLGVGDGGQEMNKILARQELAPFCTVDKSARIARLCDVVQTLFNFSNVVLFRMCVSVSIIISFILHVRISPKLFHIPIGIEWHHLLSLRLNARFDNKVRCDFTICEFGSLFLIVFCFGLVPSLFAFRPIDLLRGSRS